MKLEVKRDLTNSARDFVQKVWPAIAEWCGGGSLVPVEAVTEAPFAKLLDELSGVDAWHIRQATGQIRGIASRVQWMPGTYARPWGKPWNTFTIRLSRPSGQPTEYQKRRAAMESRDEGWLFPALTSQAYMTSRGGNLLSVAVIRTEDLYRYVDSQSALTQKATPTGERFVVVPWGNLSRAGVDMGLFFSRGNML